MSARQDGVDARLDALRFDAMSNRLVDPTEQLLEHFEQGRVLDEAIMRSLERLENMLAPEPESSGHATQHHGGTSMDFTEEHTLERILDEAIRPYVDGILAAWQDGAVVVAFFDLAPEVRAPAMRVFAWDGEPGVVAMPLAVAERLSIGSAARGDAATGRWLVGARMGRIFVLVHEGGTLLVNYELGRGYSLAPRSTDLEWKS